MSALNIGNSIRGFMEIHLINTGVRFGIFPILAESQGLTAKELASKINIPEKYAAMWCNTAFAFEVLEKKDGKFFLKSELKEALADKQSLKYMGNFIKIMASYLGEDMQNQYESIKANKFFPFYEHDQEFIELVVERGRQRGMLFLEKVMPLVEGLEENLGNGLEVLDVGCGGGSFITTLAKQFPNSNFTGIEIAEKAVQLAKEIAGKEKATANTEFMQGNAQEMNFNEKFDIATLNVVLHEINPEQREESVKRIYNSLKENGKLLILEFPYPEEDKEFFDPNYTMGIYDQFYEIIWGTEHITWTQQKELLTNCGFKDIKRTFLGDNTYVLLTAKK